MATILTCLLAFGATELDDRVVLKETATVESRYVRLMELIEEETLSDEARQAFEDVWLGASPKIGQSGRLVFAVTGAKRSVARGSPKTSVMFAGSEIVPAEDVRVTAPSDTEIPDWSLVKL